MERPSPQQQARTPAAQQDQAGVDAHYRMMVEAAKDLVIFTTDAAGIITAWPAGAEAVLGWSAAEALDRDVRFLLADEDRNGSTVDREIAQAFAKRSSRLSRWHVRKDGGRIYLEGSIRPLEGGPRARALVWSARDATAERAGQEHQKKLLAEFQHRIRNILANVRSIIHRSSHTSDSVEDLTMHLEGRIDSIARTQLMLARNPGANIELEDIIREELLAHAVPESRLSIEGPAVQLSSRAAEIITFALHELAMNSVKYGALNTDKGRIGIAWHIDKQQGEPWLKLTWTESGVRMLAVAPRREGFGSELITRRVPYELSGNGSFELRAGGVHATIEFPLRNGDSILQVERK